MKKFAPILLLLTTLSPPAHADLSYAIVHVEKPVVFTETTDCTEIFGTLLDEIIRPVLEPGIGLGLSLTCAVEDDKAILDPSMTFGVRDGSDAEKYNAMIAKLKKPIYGQQFSLQSVRAVSNFMEFKFWDRNPNSLDKLWGTVSSEHFPKSFADLEQKAFRSLIDTNSNDFEKFKALHNSWLKSRVDKNRIPRYYRVSNYATSRFETRLILDDGSVAGMYGPFTLLATRICNQSPSRRCDQSLPEDDELKQYCTNPEVPKNGMALGVCYAPNERTPDQPWQASSFFIRSATGITPL